MAATISAEGTDSWEAVSRSYSYVYQRPWQYIWYGLVAISYGAVLIFFVNFLGSFSLYLSKWTIAHTPFVRWAEREPHFLFIYAPTTFGYRDLLLDGATVKIRDTATGKDEVRPVVRNGRIDPVAFRIYASGETKESGKEVVGPLAWYNQVGAFLVACWLAVLLLVIVGFGYAYFWTASTLIYLLLRRQIDTAEVDEVYLDDEEAYRPTPIAPTTPRTPTTPTPVPVPVPAPQMVDPPALRTPPATTPTPAPTVPPPASTSESAMVKDEPQPEKTPEPDKKPDDEATI
jgi:hypothetical protein